MVKRCLNIGELVQPTRCDEYFIDNAVSPLESQRQFHNVFTIVQRQNYNVAPTLPQHWILSSTHDILWMWYWQHHCNVGIVTSVSQGLHNDDVTTSCLQCCANVSSILDSKFTAPYIIDVVKAMSICNRYAKFTT